MRLGPLRESFPATNRFGIPDLLPGLVPLSPPKALDCIGYHKLIGLAGRSICHYTDDFRFQGAWNRPSTYRQAIVASQCESIVEPDYSVYVGAPLVEQMHAVYRSRWCARFWQAAGVMVIPSLTWSDSESLEWSLSGIPRGVTVACETRHRTQRIAGFQRMLWRALEILHPRLLVTYGAPLPFPVPCEQANFPAHSPRKRMSRKTNNQTIASVEDNE